MSFTGNVQAEHNKTIVVVVIIICGGSQHTKPTFKHFDPINVQWGTQRHQNITLGD